VTLAPERKAVVTGGASGIGLAAARRLAAEGARVALLDLPGERIEAAAGETGAMAVPADVRSPREVQAAIAAALERLGGLDTLSRPPALRTPS
jgi:meso-butanediol dehydrogenase/(S,S)-butanediol dehydrogenase/diacetyl reductase